MSFRLTHPLPKECLVAVSGGVDSTAALHWLSRVEGRVRGVIHMNHNSGPHSVLSESHVSLLVEKMGLPFFNKELDRNPDKGQSIEAWWREQRYAWFKEVSTIQDNLPVVVAHTLDDCLEEYIMCMAVRGFSGTIPYSHGPCIRPFRLWKREDIVRYAEQEDLCWTEDPTNWNTRKYRRSFIRHELVPRIKQLNPGIYNIVERVIQEQDERKTV